MSAIKVGDLVRFRPRTLNKGEEKPGYLFLVGGIDGQSGGSGFFESDQTAVVTKLHQHNPDSWWALLFTDKQITGWAHTGDLSKITGR